MSPERFTSWLKERLYKAHSEGRREDTAILSEVLLAYTDGAVDPHDVVREFTSLDVRYGVGIRHKPDEIGFIAGPFKELTEALAHKADITERAYNEPGAAIVIVELPCGRILYKWKNGRWREVHDPNVPAKD